MDDSLLGDTIQHVTDSPTAAGPEASPSEGYADSTNLMISSVTKMVDSINLLNRMLQEERNISCELLKENLTLKLQNREFQRTIECILSEKNGIPTEIPTESAVNNSEKSSAEKAIEIRSELVTEAEHHHKGKQKSQSSNNSVANINQTGKQNKNKNATNKQDSHRRNTKKAANNNNTSNVPNQTKAKKIKVLIAGDSQLRRIEDSKLSNDHRQVEIKCKPGMKIKQLVNKVGKCDKEIIIIHAATNDVKSNEPESLCEQVINTLKQIQENNPKSRIAFSSIIRRKDDMALNTKLRKVNDLLEEELALNGYDFISNNNIQFCNLWEDGLHVNDGRVRKLSGNLSKYVKYC